MRKRIFTIFTLLFTILLLVACGKKEEKVLVMGIVPHKDAEKLIEEIKPLNERLTKELGITVKGFTATNYVSVVEGFGSGKVDFGIIPPFASVLAQDEFKAEPLLFVVGKNGETTYKSQFLVRSDSDIKTIADIKGKKVAFVDPSSTSGYIFPAAMLKESGIDLDKDISSLYSGGHDKSLQLLLNGDVDAISVFVDVRDRYKKEFPEAMDKTRILAYTEDIPGVSITASSSMSAEDKTRLKEAFQRIASTEDGKQLLINLFQIYNFADADAKSFDVVRRTAKTMDMDLKEQK